MRTSKHLLMKAITLRSHMQKWVDTMAAYVKSLDKNHLLTVGEEGFWSSTQSQLLDNPIYQPDGSNWATTQGQDFLADHSSPDIDFATFHCWIDNWNVGPSDLICMTLVVEGVIITA